MDHKIVEHRSRLESPSLPRCCVSYITSSGAVSVGLCANYQASDPGVQSVPTPATVNSAIHRDERELRDARFAMRLSLIFGLVMLICKTTVYFMTHSAAIFSDAAESVVHVIAVAFASLVFGSAQNQLPLNTSPVTSGLPSSPPELK